MKKGKKKAGKKAIVKRAKRKKVLPVKSKKVTIIKKIPQSNPKRKVKKRMAKKAKKTTRSKKAHRSGAGSKQDYKNIALSGAGIVGGAIGGAVLSNLIPVADLRMKAAASVLLGVLLASTNIIKGQIGKMAALGMVAGGSLSLLRRVLPNVPMLAGEDIDSIEYSGIDEIEYSGLEEDLEGEEEDMEGEFSDLEGEEDQIEGSIEELTGQIELEGADQWLMAV